MENDIEYIRNTKGDKHAKKMAKDRLSRNPDLIKERMVLNDIIQKEEMIQCTVLLASLTPASVRQNKYWDFESAKFLGDRIIIKPLQNQVLS